MKIFAIFMGLFAAISSARAADGPLGVAMGIDAASIKSCARDDDFFYICESLPKSHPSFTKYALQTSGPTGVCSVIALGGKVATSSGGLELMGAVDQLADQLTSKYGKPKKFDFAQYGSIWNRPQDWTMGLAKQERNYSYEWHKGDKIKLPDDLVGINLYASASDLNVGSITLKYFFANYERCKEVRKNSEKGAL